jgi:hypothetical protein
MERRWRQFLEALKRLGDEAQANRSGRSQTRLSHIGIHDGDPPPLRPEGIGQPRQKGGFAGVCSPQEQDRTSPLEVLQHGLPMRLFRVGRHRLRLSIPGVSDAPSGHYQLKPLTIPDEPRIRR